ncbi:MAG TPA: pyridoxal phosphate-dependent aminotransferase [Planctomycetota bacterium]
MRVSRRLEAVQAPVIPIVGDLLRATPGAISLGQGIVHYGPPPEAVDGLLAFQADPARNKYGPVEGHPALIDALRRKLDVENGCAVGPERRIVVTAGGNMGFLNAVLAIADAGDEVILNAPYYFNHEMALVMTDVRPVLVDTDDDYQLRPDAIRKAITPRTRAVVTISPNNPTGAVYPEAALREVNEICRQAGLYHIHDEAYEYFTYGARPFSPASLPGGAGHTISLYSLSKAYGFASWRIGYMVIPEALFEPVRKIQDTNVICPAVVSQYAAMGALKAGAAYARGFLPGLTEVRETAIRELSALAPRAVFPVTQGAFYFLLRLRSELPPLRIVERLVREHKVAAIPGDAFGQKACSLRVAYGALEKSTAMEGLGRLARGLDLLLR